MKLSSSSRLISTSPSNGKDSHLVKLIKIFLAALPSVIFGVFTIIFTIQQNQTANENRKQDQKQADEQSIRLTFENYIDDISKLLLDTKFNRSNSEHLLHIRAKTLTVLRYVDASRKRDIILFLYESRLLRSDVIPDERLYLKDADLNGLEFVGSASKPFQLDHLYLPGVYLPNGIFHWCILDYAVFDDASMVNIKIINSSISYVTFRRIYAPDATMGDLIFHQNNFSGAMLVRTSFVGGADWKEGIDLVNADLLDSHDSKGRLINFDAIPRNALILLNARSADGSFYSINSSELIIDGGAELGCQLDINEQVWQQGFDHPSMTLYNVKSNTTLPVPIDNGDCYFLAQSLNKSALIQLINVYSFSVLIDSGQAGYNMSAYMGCLKEQLNIVSIHIGFLKSNSLWIDAHRVFFSKTRPQKLSPQTGNIPKGTRIIRVELYAELNETSSFCVIDDIKLNIFYEKKNGCGAGVMFTDDQPHLTPALLGQNQIGTNNIE